MRLQPLIVIATLIVVTSSIIRVADAQPFRFEAVLSGAQEVTDPPGGLATPTTGFIGIEVDTPLSEITFKLDVLGGVGVTEAHFHCGRAGENGPVIAFLFGPVESGDVNGELASGTLTNENIVAEADCITAIERPVNNVASFFFAAKDGLIYVNVHTITHPLGEVRGQLIILPNTENGSETPS